MCTYIVSCFPRPSPQTLYNAMLEDKCSEHASRTSAMQSFPCPFLSLVLTLFCLPSPLVFMQTLYNAMLENNCSEHASRMSAMENSSKSAGEILDKLTLQYNRDRQAQVCALFFLSF